MVLTAQVFALVFAAATGILLAALGRSSRRKLYYYWAASWFCYALSLAAAVAQGRLAGPSYWAVIEFAAIGLAALFLVGGRRQMLDVPVELVDEWLDRGRRGSLFYSAQLHNLTAQGRFQARKTAHPC